MDLRPGARSFLLLAAVATLAAPAARANELQDGCATSGFEIHDAAETLRDYCAPDSLGRLWLALPGGARYELITSITDPAIWNPGDGAFHPFEAAEVRAALAALNFPVDGLHADVFLLPYPRRSGLESAAGPGLVLLAPGVRPLSREQQHAEFVHELGHVVHRALLPDSDATAWSDYRALRGIEDPNVFGPLAAHAYRPHEIFAEDFRALFGDGLANYSGSIENSTIAPPSRVDGLREFMQSLAGSRLAVVGVARPNPARGAVRFERPGGAVPLDVFDAQGRLVASLAPAGAGGGVRWDWDGRGQSGAAAGAGMFFARPRDGVGGVIRVTRLR